MTRAADAGCERPPAALPDKRSLPDGADSLCDQTPDQTDFWGPQGRGDRRRGRTAGPGRGRSAPRAASGARGTRAAARGARRRPGLSGEEGVGMLSHGAVAAPHLSPALRGLKQKRKRMPLAGRPVPAAAPAASSGTVRRLPARPAGRPGRCEPRARRAGQRPSVRPWPRGRPRAAGSARSPRCRCCCRCCCCCSSPRRRVGRGAWRGGGRGAARAAPPRPPLDAGGRGAAPAGRGPGTPAGSGREGSADRRPAPARGLTRGRGTGGRALNPTPSPFAGQRQEAAFAPGAPGRG